MTVDPVIDEETARKIAIRFETEHPLWMVIFGVYTQQFVCFPRFKAPSGTMVIATYPEALPDRIRRAEKALRERQQKKDEPPRPRHVIP